MLSTLIGINSGLRCNFFEVSWLSALFSSLVFQVRLIFVPLINLIINFPYDNSSLENALTKCRQTNESNYASKRNDAFVCVHGVFLLHNLSFNSAYNGMHDISISRQLQSAFSSRPSLLSTMSIHLSSTDVCMVSQSDGIVQFIQQRNKKILV